MTARKSDTAATLGDGFLTALPWWLGGMAHARRAGREVSVVRESLSRQQYRVPAALPPTPTPGNGSPAGSAATLSPATHYAAPAPLAAAVAAAAASALRRAAATPASPAGAASLDDVAPITELIDLQTPAAVLTTSPRTPLTFAPGAGVGTPPAVLGAPGSGGVGGGGGGNGCVVGISAVPEGTTLVRDGTAALRRKRAGAIGSGASGAVGGVGVPAAVAAAAGGPAGNGGGFGGAAGPGRVCLGSATLPG